MVERDDFLRSSLVVVLVFFKGIDDSGGSWGSLTALMSTVGVVVR